MRLLYNLSIYFFQFSVRIAAGFNSKAKKWIVGRKKQFKEISSAIGKSDRIVWFHCASLGEFEQGKPIMEAVRNIFPNHKILLTFFSPSGYEVRKNTEVADFVFYLPGDTQKNARKFIRIVNPRIAIFIKYEFWFNYINELSKNKIPLLVVSAIFRPSQYFFKPWGFWSSHHLQKVANFYVQDEASLNLLNKVNVFHADISGDTRFDRVVKVVSEKRPLPVIESFAKGRKLIVAGSTWSPDEAIVLNLVGKLPGEFVLVVAPHEVNEERISQLMLKFKDYNPQKYSEYAKTENYSSKVLIIDNIGLLAFIYRYAYIAYVGGGFGVGIHNVLEAAAYGIPVVFGSNYEKFREAVELKQIGTAFSVSNANECETVFRELIDDQIKYNQCCTDARTYVQDNAGATGIILEKVKSYLVAD